MTSDRWRLLRIFLLLGLFLSGAHEAANSIQEARKTDGANPNAQAKAAESVAGAGVAQPQLFKVGGKILPPQPIHTPDPKYPKGVRGQAQGSEVLWMIVTAEGKPSDIKVTRSLGPEFDEKAIDAVGKWRFKPATKDGQPVAVEISVHLDFRRY